MQNAGPTQTPKLNYGKTMLIGTGFFASSLLWSLYNSMVPLILKGFIASSTIIGLIMTIDNIFGVIFQPLFGSLSDRTRSRFGRQIPYILFAAPPCALLFYLIPRVQHLLLLMLVIIFFNFLMSVWRAPIIALMPDLTPSPLWSKANGVINLMGGLAGIVAFLVGGKIAKAYGREASFLMGAIVMLLAVLILCLFVREHSSAYLPRRDFGVSTIDTNLDANASDCAGETEARRKAREAEEQEKKINLAAFRKLPKARRHNLLYLLLAIFFWFCAYNAVETFFTSYAVTHLQMHDGDATVLLAFFSLAFVAFALPSGIIAGRVGRRKLIVIGLIGLVVVFIPMVFIQNIWMLRVLLLIGGVFWACININSLPMALELGHEDEIGTFTGYYYFFSFSASIVSPILFGLLRDLTGTYTTLFVYAPVSFAVALYCILRMKSEAQQN